jgi:hypothetical protein
MNRLKEHWLLLNVLTTVVNISFNMESKVVGFVEGFKILDEFDLELLTLQKKCNKKSLKVIRPFLLFLKTFDLRNVHNMITIMLEPCFKSLDHCVIIRLVFKYDAKVMIPLLMACFD